MLAWAARLTYTGTWCAKNQCTPVAGYIEAHYASFRYNINNGLSILIVITYAGAIVGLLVSLNKLTWCNGATTWCNLQLVFHRKYCCSTNCHCATAMKEWCNLLAATEEAPEGRSAEHGEQTGDPAPDPHHQDDGDCGGADNRLQLRANMLVGSGGFSATGRWSSGQYLPDHTVSSLDILYAQMNLLQVSTIGTYMWSLYAFNCAANLLIYAKSNKEMRAAFKRTLMPWKQDNQVHAIALPAPKPGERQPAAAGH